MSLGFKMFKSVGFLRRVDWQINSA